MKLKVWKWYHNWGDDSGTMLYPSEAAAIQAIHSYVHDQWNDGLMDEDIEFSGDASVDIEMYFDWHSDDEWYSLESQIVEFPDIPEVPDQDVVLDSDECAAIIALIDYCAPETLNGVLSETGKTKKEANLLLNGVYQKLKD